MSKETAKLREELEQEREQRKACAEQRVANEQFATVLSRVSEHPAETSVHYVVTKFAIDHLVLSNGDYFTTEDAYRAYASLSPTSKAIVYIPRETFAIILRKYMFLRYGVVDERIRTTQHVACDEREEGYMHFKLISNEGD